MHLRTIAWGKTVTRETRLNDLCGQRDHHTCGGPTSWRRETRRGQTLGCVTALTNLLQHQGAEEAEAYRWAQSVVAKVGAPRVMRIAAETNDLKRHKGILGLASAAGAKLPNLSGRRSTGRSRKSRPRISLCAVGVRKTIKDSLPPS